MRKGKKIFHQHNQPGAVEIVYYDNKPYIRLRMPNEPEQYAESIDGKLVWPRPIPKRLKSLTEKAHAQVLDKQRKKQYNFSYLGNFRYQNGAPTSAIPGAPPCRTSTKNKSISHHSPMEHPTYQGM